MTALPSKLKAIHEKLNTDTRYFAEHAPLYIKNKDSGILHPFRFNQAQVYLEKCLEEQRRDKGWVRALIVKGRQQGCSTYINARFYHRSTRAKGKNVFVMAHDDETTELLFKAVKRFHDNVNPAVRPHTKYSSRRELDFDNLEAQYRIGTAGNPNVGRGGTVHLFHGSEAAYWKNALEIKSGIIQSVPRASGTEIVLESTANGMDEMFYPMVMDAIKGIGDYIAIFIPWFWQDEYRAEHKDDFKLEDDELEYQKLYGLDLAQIAWRRLKIIEIGPTRFKQEYPANIMEAFQSTGDSLVKPESIMRARKCTKKDVNAPIILGCDPGREGDPTEIIIRRGREIIDWLVWDKMNQMVLAGVLIKLIKDNKVDMAFVDAGEGNGTVDRCHELGYQNVIAVYFGQSATENEIYINKRAEMLILSAEWLDEPDVNIPDDDEFHRGLMMIPTYFYSSNGRKQLLSKEKIKEKFKGLSTNTHDALGLTFAEPVARNLGEMGRKFERKSSQTTMSRFKLGGKR